MSLTEAQLECELLGGYLAEPKTEDQAALLVITIQFNKYFVKSPGISLIKFDTSKFLPQTKHILNRISGGGSIITFYCIIFKNFVINFLLNTRSDTNLVL